MMEHLQDYVWLLGMPLLTIIFIVVTLWRQGQTPTFANVVSATQEGMGMAQDVAEVAMQGVLAAEQLAIAGKITKDERFEHAFAHVKSWFPQADLQEDQITDAIESAVMLVKLGVVASQVIGRGASRS